LSVAKTLGVEPTKEVLNPERVSGAHA